MRFVTQTSEVMSLFHGRSLSLELKLLSLLGFADHMQRATWFLFDRRLLIFANLLHSFLQIFGAQLMNIVANWNVDAIEVFASACLTVLHVYSCVFHVTLYYRIEDIQQLVEDLHEMQSPKQLDDEYSRSCREKADRFARWLVVFGLMLPMLLVGVIFVLIISITVLYRERKLIHSMWLPYDATVTPQYQLTQFTVIILLQLAASAVGTCYAFLINIPIHIIAQFKILQYNLKNIRERAAARVSKKSEDYRTILVEDITEEASLRTHEEPLMEWNKKLHIADVLLKPSGRGEIQETTNSINCDMLMSTSSLNPGLDAASSTMRIHNDVTDSEEITGEPSTMNMTSQRKVDIPIDDEMKILLAECIIHHQALLRLIDEYESIMDPILSSTLMINYLMFGLTMIMHSKVDSFNPVAMLCSSIALFIYLTLFILTWLMSEIMEQSTLVCDAAYECDWLDATPEFKRSLRIVMSRANCETVIQAAKFIPYLLPTFVSVSKQAFSVYEVFSSLSVH